MKQRVEVHGPSATELWSTIQVLDSHGRDEEVLAPNAIKEKEAVRSARFLRCLLGHHPDTVVVDCLDQENTMLKLNPVPRSRWRVQPAERARNMLKFQ